MGSKGKGGTATAVDTTTATAPAEDLVGDLAAERPTDLAGMSDEISPLLGSVADVLSSTARAHIAHADALDFLRSLPPACADILATDPPYSSGGMVRGDRAKSGLAAAKYGRAEQTAEIHGDTMDARSYAFWAMLWLREARRVLKIGAFALVFTDWRQLPNVSDAVQAAGLVWRGVTVWNKGNAMPNKGRFRQDCEFVVVTTNGPRACGPKVPEPCYPGCYDVPQDPEDRSDLEDLPAYMRLTLPRSERRAVCSKPVALMEGLIGPCPAGGVALDPFVGWGATPVAALRTGRRFLGCEISEANLSTALGRLAGPEVDQSLPKAAA